MGAEYTKERIKERIETKHLGQAKRIAALLHRRKKLRTDYAARKLIDTSDEKYQQSPGLKHWAKLQNLKIAAASYHKSQSLAELEQQLSAKSKIAKTALSSLVETERELKELGQIIKYAEQYKSNRIYQLRYQKAKDKDSYLRRHETELLLYDGAENMLKQLGVSTKTLDIDKLRDTYNSLYSKKETLQHNYKKTEHEISLLTQKLNALQQYFKTDQQKSFNLIKNSHNDLGRT